MATSDFDVELFERRLQTLKDSQESIQGLSAWCLERRQHHKKIVATWLQVLKKVKVEHRLTLFYLANDVIQYSKRKNFEFVESWGTTLQRATTMVRDEKVKHRILRIFKIWDQRQVYDEEFLADLSGLISAAPKKKAEPQALAPPEEFQAALLISTMRSCATLEQATDARLRDLRESNIDIENAEELCASLKDRRRVEDAEKEVDLAVRNVENYVRALEAEIRERTQVLELLEQADQFYETQRGEVKIVTNAYRNFGSRVKNLKKKLDELLPTLVSPLPSPDINAPSPSPDSDIDLPGDESQHMNQLVAMDVAPPSIYGTYSHDYDPVPVPAPDLGQGNDPSDFTNNFSSFMGGNVDFSNMRSLFNERSSTPTGMSQQYNDSLEAKPIEVISMRPSKSESKSGDFNISSFLKTVLPSSDGATHSGGIPGLGLDIPDSQVESPQRSDYRLSPGGGKLPITPIGSRLMSSQGPSLASISSCPMGHSTPLAVRNLSGESHTPSPYSSQNSQSNMTVPFDTPTNNTVNPLPPPPLPPPIFLDDENCYNKLPPKFPTWTPPSESMKEPKWEDKLDSFSMSTGKNSINSAWSPECDEKNKRSWMDEEGERWDSNNENTWPNPIRGKSEIISETPESPPMYEKSGFTEPVQYDDTQPRESLLGTTTDVDHRVIPVPITVENQLPYRLMKAGDVDHRNLISLTGSPANHNVNDISLNTLPNNSNLWSTGDQDYRQHMQPGDIVESVDMEMSDDETDTKPKGRVLVDVRSQDRDMRIGNQPGSSHLDMDMRIIPLPSGQLTGPREQMMQDIHMIRPGLPPPPPPPNQFHPNQAGFHQDQSEFRHNPPSDFHGSQSNFHQNRGPGNFLQNQQDFHANQQDFHPIHPPQSEFHQPQQDFEYCEPPHNLRTNQEFMSELPGRGRYSQPMDHQHRDNSFHRNDRNNRGGRGFPRNRRDRYSDDHNLKQRGIQNMRKSRMQELQRISPEILPNSRPLLLQPPESIVILDDDGMPIKTPESIEKENAMNVQDRVQDAVCEGNGQGSLQSDRRLLNDNSNVHDADHNSIARLDTEDQQQQQCHITVVPVTTDSIEKEPEQYVPISEYEEHVQSDAVQSEKVCIENNELIENPNRGTNFSESSPHLSEQLEALMNSAPSSSNDLKRQSANGSFEEHDQEDGSSSKKRVLISNGPQISESESGPNGGADQLVATESLNVSPNFRPRLGGAPHFPPWRGPPRGRGGFRGGPRGPWMDRSPRGPSPGTFIPRGMKRGGQFRGNGFRGRGRGSNW